MHSTRSSRRAPSVPCSSTARTRTACWRMASLRWLRRCAVPDPDSGDVDIDVLPVVVGLARQLRDEGVDADQARVMAMVRALAALDPSRREDVYWAGRLTLCG